jgi:hypothetical protein
MLDGCRTFLARAWSRVVLVATLRNLVFRQRVDHEAGARSLPRSPVSSRFTNPASSSVARQSRSPRTCFPEPQSRHPSPWTPP